MRCRHEKEIDLCPECNAPITLDSWLSAMEARCRAATPGERYVAETSDGRYFVRSKELTPNGSIDHAIAETWGGTGPRPQDADYIASLSPDVLSAMLECVRVLQDPDNHWHAPNDTTDHCSACNALARLTEIVAREGGADG